MIDTLYEVCEQLPDLLQDRGRWDSLIIDKRRPITRRVFTMMGQLRVCLHEFEYIGNTRDDEAFWHPHAWPAAIHVLNGAYLMGARLHREPRARETHQDLLHGHRSRHRLQHDRPLEWHRIIPQTPLVHTIMINGPRWPEPIAHRLVRTTTGKGLVPLSPEHLDSHLKLFSELLAHQDCLSGSGR
jgi:hypothetical protein